MITVLLADDQQLVRTGIRRIFESEPDLRVVAEAGDGADAVALASSHHPDVVLMDIRMPRLDGLTATQTLTASNAAPKVVIPTTFDPDEYVYQALRAGASGFLLKTSPAAELVAVIRAAHEGDAMLAPPVTRRLIAEFAQRPDPARADALAAELEHRASSRSSASSRAASPTQRSAASCTSVRRRSSRTSQACCRSSGCATASNSSSPPTRTASSAPAKQPTANRPYPEAPAEHRPVPRRRAPPPSRAPRARALRLELGAGARRAAPSDQDSGSD